MVYLTIEDVLLQHTKVIDRTGGAHGLRDKGALESAVAQPKMTFGGEDLYPGLVEKAAVLGFSLIANHPFLDGNKRIGYVSMEVFLIINGYELLLDIDEHENIILQVASGEMTKDNFTNWVRTKVTPL